MKNGTSLLKYNNNRHIFVTIIFNIAKLRREIIRYVHPVQNLYYYLPVESQIS